MAKKTGLLPILLILALMIGVAAPYTFLKPASIISVSQIAMDATGAQIGDYVNSDYRKLTNGYWAITLSINSYQSVYAIKFGPQNTTGYTLNGQKVTTNRVVQFNIDPTDPYLLMDLVKYQNIQYTPSASGFKITTPMIVAGDPMNGQTIVTTTPSLVTYVTPKKLALATVHVPFKIDVLVAGGQVGSTTQDKTASGVQTFTISPTGNLDAYPIQTAYGMAVVQFHGYLSSPVQLPYGLDHLVFLPYNTINSIQDNAGNKYLVVLDAEDRILTGYRQYFYGGITSSTSAYNNLAGVPINTNSPGWGYSEFKTISGLTWYSFWPLQANLTGKEPGGYYYTLNPGWLGDYIKQVTNPRSGLLDWLVDQNPNNVIKQMSYFQSWKVENPDANNIRLNAQLPQNIFTPMITILIPFEMADTLVYSPKITTFRIDSVNLPSELRAGVEGTLTVKITNTGNTRGTANIKVVPDANLNVFPLSQALTLDPNQQGSIDFLIRTGSISADITSVGKIEVYDSIGTMTDSKSFSILLKPLLSRLYISGITLNPNKLKPGESAKLIVKVTNQGGGSNARGTVKIVTDNFLACSQKEKTADIAPGVEYSFEFQLTAGTAAGVSSLKIELYDQDGHLLESQTLSVTVSSDPPNNPPPVLVPTPVDWWIWALLGLTGALMVTVGLYLKTPITDTLVKFGFMTIVAAIVGYMAQSWLLSEVAILSYSVPVWQLLAGVGVAFLLLTIFIPKKFKLPKIKVKRR